MRNDAQELAQKIADDAATITTYISDFSMKSVYGGTSSKEDIALFSEKTPRLVIVDCVGTGDTAHANVPQSVLI